MADNDLGFTFDTKFFEKGINKVMKGFSNMEMKASTVAKGVSKGLTAMVGKLSLVYAGFRTIKSALLGMPEVGQAFGIAKDVFMKNLLYPLRKEIFPLLQKMLDWVRDSRVRFVKWGQNLANIFRAVVSGVKSIIGFIKRMSIVVSGFAEKIFGDRIKSIDNIFNLVTFKLATLIQFISVLVENIGGIFTGFFSGLGDISGPLKGIIDNLGDFLKIFTQANNEGDSFKSVLTAIGSLFGEIVGFIVTMTDKFLDGFVPAISSIMTPLRNIADAWASIFDNIFGSTEAMKGWETIFKAIGEVVGTTILKAFEAIAFIVEGIAKIVDFLINWEDKEWFVGSGEFGGFKGPDRNRSRDTETRESSGRRGVNDAILRPDGSIIETNPKDTLVAMKDFDSSLSNLFGGVSKSETNITIPVDFTGMQILVQNGGVEEGQEFAMGLVEQMRNELNSEFERFGA